MSGQSSLRTGLKEFFMKKVLIFGSGSTGSRICGEIKDSCEVIGFLDNDESKWGGKCCALPVLGNADSCKSLDFDEVILGSLTALDVMPAQLVAAGVEPSKINRSFVETQVKARVNFLRDYAASVTEEPGVAVAEGGVFQGEFAKEINRAFPKSTLYLFDTFEGFDERDIRTERENGFSSEGVSHLNITSESLVLSKLPHPGKAVIRKGFFPETAAGLEDARFQFVNLDFDLHDPILAGLRFFYPRMIRGGVLLVHDYFNPGYKGVAQAVADYERECRALVKIPIGDHCSICIVKV